MVSNSPIGNIWVVYKWYIHCQLGDYILPIPPIKGTRKLHWPFTTRGRSKLGFRNPSPLNLAGSVSSMAQWGTLLLILWRWRRGWCRGCSMGTCHWGFSGTLHTGTPWAPYYSHTTPIRIPWRLWEACMGSAKTIRGPIIESTWNHPWTWWSFLSFLIIHSMGLPVDDQL